MSVLYSCELGLLTRRWVRLLVSHYYPAHLLMQWCLENFYVGLKWHSVIPYIAHYREEWVREWVKDLNTANKPAACCRFSKKNGLILLFFQRLMGKPVCLVCIQQISVLKEYNLNATIRLIMLRITITSKDNWEQRRYENCRPVWRNSSLFIVIDERWATQLWKLATLLLTKQHPLQSRMRTASLIHQCCYLSVIMLWFLWSSWGQAGLHVKRVWHPFSRGWILTLLNANMIVLTWLWVQGIMFTMFTILV